MSSGLCMFLLCAVAFVDILPTPQHARFDDRRSFTPDASVPVAIWDSATRDDLPVLEGLFEALGYRPTVVTAGQLGPGHRAFHIGEADSHSVLNHRSYRRYLPDASEMGPESYRLHILRDGVVIAGTDRAGTLRGIATLVQILRAQRQSGRSGLPLAEIRDYPDVAVRGVHIRGDVSAEDLHALAAVKCNFLVLESPEFYRLDPAALAKWKPRFALARSLGIEAVPLLQLFQGAEPWIAQQPHIVEGRTRIDRLTLVDEDWAAFSRFHVVQAPGFPIQVRLGDRLLEDRVDYVLSEGGIEPPFQYREVYPWMIRRLPGGAIPSGAQVSVLYSHATPGSDALCPHAPESWNVMESALRELHAALRPGWLHMGGAELSRINQDMRCRAKNLSPAEVFRNAMQVFFERTQQVHPGWRVMYWTAPMSSVSPAWTPFRNPADTEGGRLSVSRLRLTPGWTGAAEQEISRFLQSGHAAVAAVSARSPQAWRLLRRMAGGNRTGGIIVTDADPRSSRTSTLLAQAWSAKSSEPLWPLTLNTVFDSSLWDPSFQEIAAAVFASIERAVVAGEAPSSVRARMEQRLNAARAELPRDHPQVLPAADLLDVALRYLDLEYAFSSGSEQDALRDLLPLLRRYEELNPDADPERMDRITETVRDRRSFVPAPILFGMPLAYYRPFALPAGAVAREVPIRPEYVDTAGKTVATVNLLVSHGPVFRVDFETVAARAARLEESRDGVTYKPVDGRVWEGGGSIRGPLMLHRPVEGPWIRFHVESYGQQAVLREMRMFALKHAPRSICPAIDSASTPMAWPEADTVTGFVCLQTGRFAVAPTEIKWVRARDHLFVGIIAQDPLPHASRILMSGQDEPLWEAESVELRVRPGARPARRFLTNPLGARHDAMEIEKGWAQWDTGWDAEWRVQAETTATGWTATLRIPLAVFGGAPSPGTAWELAAIRHRHNVESETSSWAQDADTGYGYGVLVFP